MSCYTDIVGSYGLLNLIGIISALLQTPVLMLGKFVAARRIIIALQLYSRYFNFHLRRRKYLDSHSLVEKNP